ncbi:MAG: hypothetical protein K2N24_00560 [Lachnospiraceae bacterium]|nr:hypothetical protein [Lachnospiraceae bacterium]
MEEAGDSSTEASVGDVEITEGKTHVVYYSATGYTESVAGYIAEATDGELFKLEPVEEYSSADLDWTNKNSRVSREHDNPEEKEAAGTGEWLTGERFRSDASEETVKEWVESLSLE